MSIVINRNPIIREFKCTVINRRGKKIKLNIIARDKKEATQKLFKYSFKPIRIIDKTPIILINKTKLKDVELMLFFRKLKDYIENSFELLTAVESFLNENFSYKFKLFLFSLISYIKEGYSFYESMKKVNVLNESFLHMIRVGEESSNLSEMFGKISDLIEKKILLRKKLIKSLRGPILTLLFAIGIVIFVLPVLIKPVKDLFANFGSDKIPKLTKYVISIQDFVSNNYYFLILGFLFTLLLFIYTYINSKKFKSFIDKLLLSIPMVKDVIIHYNIYIILITLQTYVESGQKFIQAFKEIADSLYNEELKEEYLFLYKKGREGYSLKDVLIDVVYMPPLYKDILISADEKGTLNKDLKELIKLGYKDFSEISDKFVSRLSSAIGIFVMLIVGIIIFAVYMPMFGVINVINESISSS
jgi:type II secretory pathway component PulF